MSIFKKKFNQIDLAKGVYEFIKQARFRDISVSILPKDTSSVIIDKLFRAQIYLVIVSTINYFPDKSITIEGLIFLIYENLFKEIFPTYDEFRNYFDMDFQDFEKMLHFGEKTGNGMFFGISRWIFDDPKCNVDPIEQLKIVPHLFTVFDSICKTHKDNQNKIKIIG